MCAPCQAGNYFSRVTLLRSSTEEASAISSSITSNLRDVTKKTITYREPFGKGKLFKGKKM
uniref:Uncharacterized protein n=1 Tax=Anguilla anguilla TaxID=7936 RepID=A0A0E9UQE5_ANGAN